MTSTSDRAAPRVVVLMGSQRFERTVGERARSLEVEGRFALVTAGWQEREREDEELRAHLGGDAVNLELHRRVDEVFREDPELAEAHRARQQRLRFKQDFYRVRLEHALAASHVIRQRRAPADVLAEEEEAALAAIRALDEWHLAQCARIHADFDAQYRPASRPVVERHREELAGLLEASVAVAIAGGHVISLLNRLRLFDIASLFGSRPVFAWSAGAMAVSERVVLFHDRPPQGPGAAEVLDRGLGLVPGLVVLPEPEARLRLEDPERVGVLARRFAPARCVAFPAGAHLLWRQSRFARPDGALELAADGSCSPLVEAAA